MTFLDYGHNAKSFAEMLKGGMDVPLKPPRPVPVTAVVVAAGIDGYLYAYDEVADASNQRWTPSSVDFLAAAAAAKWPNTKIVQAFTTANFFSGLRALPGKIARIVFMGYDQRHSLALAAMRQRISPRAAALFHQPMLLLNLTQHIDAAELNKAKVSLGVIHRKLVPGAGLDIITHDGFLDRRFAQDLASAFGVPVRYCSYPVLWQLVYNLASLSVWRGQINVQPNFNIPPYTVNGAHVINLDQVVTP
jgi:hypothetical protein